MPDKRKPSASMSGSSPYAKRSRPSPADEGYGYGYDGNEEQTERPAAKPTHERPRHHPIYGQKGAFPGLDVADDNELFYGPAEDGLEYLRMVRSEANSLPFLFTAPAPVPPVAVAEAEAEGEKATVAPTRIKSHIHDDRNASSPEEGVIIDGVFFVPPPKKPSTANTTANSTTQPTQQPPSYPPAQNSYYTLLHHRFILLRSILKCTPPSEAIAALDDSHPISLPRHARNARKEWRRLVLAVEPQTVQLACMDLESVLAVLGVVARLMSENVRSGDAERVRRIGAWAWGLLGKCREVGMLGTEEVGEIRDLGKRAVKILGKMREDEEEMGEGKEDGEDEEGEGEGGNEGREEVPGPSDGLDHDMQDAAVEPGADELEAAKARLQAKIQGAEEQDGAGEVAVQTRAMLDMIITFTTTTMATNLEIAIPTTSISPTSPPYTLYNITLRLPLRSFSISKRYSDFTTFHTTLTTQTTLPPPAPLPPNPGLETYLRSINESADPRWRSSPVWRAFLNLPSLPGLSNVGGGIGNANNGGLTSTRLHAAITDPTSDPGSANSITDPTLWLDCFRDMKGHLHDARLHLTRRDQETTPQKQHESSARAKSSLVRAGGLIGALEAGLRNLSSSPNNTTTNNNNDNKTSGGSGGGNGTGGSRPTTARRGTNTFSVSGNTTLGEGEMRRRKDLLINARKEKDGLEDLLNAMAAKSRIDSAVASVQDKEALMGTSGSGRKGGRSSGRVLGRETERTRELDNSGVVQLQKQMMADQDLSVNELMKVVHRQKELGIAIHNELEVQNELLRLADEDATRLGGKIDVGKKRVGRIS
ncbi:hypothetical protein BO70DRAFT_368226 [Aspergillus heteromorphus CBS 117.55]|uniref:t-SNARE coiled-coil homology domain-containing protein n=1 Tax=Aspergillus heteromorphus CBS 117.55 TaxID=1448321 RepID=A0A317WYM6_9EURO|nr:uncharacterized protein BO70DRAFT_368226 [Aspergillus heteromorphus CBS 117.55]PWY91051.1 hypothetical protein BO70DRAFT_368226 [Aspergillus heteromorphus CBS 117.55]